MHECFTLLNSIPTVQVSDTTMLNSSNIAGYIKVMSCEL